MKKTKHFLTRLLDYVYISIQGIYSHHKLWYRYQGVSQLVVDNVAQINYLRNNKS